MALAGLVVKISTEGKTGEELFQAKLLNIKYINFGDRRSPDILISETELAAKDKAVEGELTEREEIIRNHEEELRRLKLTNANLAQELEALKLANEQLQEKLEAERLAENRRVVDTTKQRYELSLIERFPSKWSEIKAKMKILTDGLEKVANKDDSMPKGCMYVLSGSHILEIQNRLDCTSLDLYPLKENVVKVFKEGGKHKGLIASVGGNPNFSSSDYRDQKPISHITFQWLKGGSTPIGDKGFLIINDRLNCLKFVERNNRLVAKSDETILEATLPPGNLLLEELILMLERLDQTKLLDTIIISKKSK